MFQTFDFGAMHYKPQLMKSLI